MKNILCGVYALVCCTLVYGQSQDNMLSPEVLYVTLEPGVRLEVLDWGGKGEPIMFLAGLGNTAQRVWATQHTFMKGLLIILSKSIRYLD